MEPLKYAGILEIGVPHMKQLQLTPAPRRIRREDGKTLRPCQNVGDRDFLRRYVWQRDVLRGMAIVQIIGLYGQTITNVAGLNFAQIIGDAAAGIFEYQKRENRDKQADPNDSPPVRLVKCTSAAQTEVIHPTSWMPAPLGIAARPTGGSMGRQHPYRSQIHGRCVQNPSEERKSKSNSFAHLARAALRAKLMS